MTKTDTRNIRIPRLLVNCIILNAIAALMMKPIVLIVLLIISQAAILYSQTNGKDNRQPYAYSDSSKSSISIVKIDTGNYANQYQYLIKESMYHIDYLYKDGKLNHFIAKETTTTLSYSGTEGQQSHISINLIPLDNTTIESFAISKDCDGIDLRTDYYKTVDYGCCGGENLIRYYSYDKQKILCEGSNELRSYEIPNAHITCYIGFKTNDTKDSTLTGFLTIGYNTGAVFKVALYEYNQKHSPFAPKITIVTGNPKDELFDKVDTPSRIWSLDGIGSISQINHITILLAFETELTPFVVKIPIINGKPFGKSDEVQSLRLN